MCTALAFKEPGQVRSGRSVYRSRSLMSTKASVFLEFCLPISNPLNIPVSVYTPRLVSVKLFDSIAKVELQMQFSSAPVHAMIVEGGHARAHSFKGLTQTAHRRDLFIEKCSV